MNLPRTGEAGICLEQVPLRQIAERFGTPAYVYSRAAIVSRYRAFAEALSPRPHLICYAVKACSNIAVLNLLADCGSGFDIVSGGELARVMRAGGDAGKTVFSGVGKTREEIRHALTAGVRCLNIESAAELDAVEAVADGLGVEAPIAMRLNPAVDAQTHAYITTGLDENKFGVPFDEAEALYARAAASRALKPLGVGCHIGSQISSLDPFRLSAQALTAFADRLLAGGLSVAHIDFGGGLGIGPDAPCAEDYVQILLDAVGERPLEVWIEPGRAVVGEAGVLLTRVTYLKSGAARSFAVTDAAMNDLIRPALYQADHPVIAVAPDAGTEKRRLDVVGPVCESGDFLARDCELAAAEGDLLAVLDAGAYGFSMASNYNSRARPAEVLVDGSQAHLIRQRESADALMLGEQLCP